MSYGYEGNLVRLAPLDEDKHFENALRWINDPEVTQHLLVGHFPMSRLAEKDWFESRCRAKDDLLFAIETLDGEHHIGFSGVHQIDFRHGTSVTGTIIGAKEMWGKGYGSDAAKVRAYYAFEILGLRLLLSAYFDGNERSRRMQEATGYRECGRIPARFWKNGAYRDEILTYLDRETWRKANGPQG